MDKAGRLEKGDGSKVPVPVGANRGISIIDLILRLVGIAGTLGAAIAMGTNEQTLPFFTRFVQFSAEYDDFRSFRLFVVVNAILAAYFVLTIPLSIVHIMRSAARGSRILLIILDTIMLALLTAGASAAASIVYLAHNGNSSTNWLPVCQQYGDFCQMASGSLIGSFGGIVMLILTILLGAIALSRQARRVL
ncbi:putative casparian strip membrane protein [Helianthus annuus]|nr:putative casparian strip membrane protein [Helianthus annuus]KAJ0900215.1 putative casparian strip membrane protein [Helianthus annuus]